MDSSIPPPHGYCNRNAAANAYIVHSSIALAIASIIVPLRMFVRLKIVRAFWWDDVFIVLAFSFMVPSVGIVLHGTTLGAGRHLGCYSTDTAIEIAKHVYAAEEVQILSVIFARTSAALFVIRLFAVNQALKRFMYGYIALICISLGFTAIALWFQCKPIAGLWDPLLHAKCWPTSARNFLNYFNGVVSIIGDLVPALLPAYFLRNLQMSNKQKIAISTLMGLGIIPATCATIRTTMEYKATTKDAIYDVALLTNFSILELTMATICATIPALPPLFDKEKRSRDAKPRYHYDEKIRKYRRTEDADDIYLSSKRWYISPYATNSDNDSIRTQAMMGNGAIRNTRGRDRPPFLPVYGIGKRVDISVFA